MVPITCSIVVVALRFLQASSESDAMEAVDVVKVIMALNQGSGNGGVTLPPGHACAPPQRVSVRTLVAAMSTIPKDSALMLQAIRVLIDSLECPQDFEHVARTNLDKYLIEVLKGDRVIEHMIPTLYQFTSHYENNFQLLLDDYDKRRSVTPSGPPKTGTSQPMLYPPPSHSARMPEDQELCHYPAEWLSTRKLLSDIKRIVYPDGVQDMLVYDSIGDGEDLEQVAEVNGIRVKSSIGQDGAYVQPAYFTSLPPYYKLGHADDETLIFESRFECGNLRRALKIYDHEYDLILSPDLNTFGHTQWFYFCVSNTRKGKRYKFNIINMAKPDSMYNYGMMPLMYSETEYLRSGVGWTRVGEEICYYKNHIRGREGNHYTLSFVIEFQHSRDNVSLAMCYPYTYSYLQRFLGSVLRDPERSKYVERRSLCTTIAGNLCDVLTITSYTGDPQALRRRKGVVITARVHPGETNASWMMHGIIDYLTSSCIGAQILRDNFVFKIIPMLNPDGVISGNYRCSLVGVDLNRQWADPQKEKHPTVYFAKKLIRELHEERGVMMYCDLHGHSRKPNFFMYGCSPGKKDTNADRMLERVFPFMMSKNNEFFSFDDCDFRITKSKETTARVVVYRELGITNSYTLEGSFCGPNIGEYKGTHFNTQHFQQVGHRFCETLLDYFFADDARLTSTVRDIETLSGVKRKDGGDDETDSDSNDEGKIIKKSTKSKSDKKKLKKKSEDKKKSTKSSKPKR